MSVLEGCPSYRQSNKGSKERQGPTVGVRLIEVSVKRELTAVYNVSSQNHAAPILTTSGIRSAFILLKLSSFIFEQVKSYLKERSDNINKLILHALHVHIMIFLSLMTFTS